MGGGRWQVEVEGFGESDDSSDRQKGVGVGWRAKDLPADWDCDGGFGDLDQVMRAGLDTLITGEADYPTEVKAKELGINLILGGHRETEKYGTRELTRTFV